MKQIAKDYLGKDITDAIVTVPASFDDLQRKATQAAGKIAGLNVIRTINEPTAAAIAYGLNGDNVKEKNVLIFDLGSGIFDVTILSIDGSFFEVRASRGDMHLGGQDFDNEIVNFCINEFKEQSGIDISDNIKAKCKLKVESEKAKKNLSSAKEISIDIDTLAEGEDFNITISRPEFEDMCKTHFEKLIPIVEDTLKDANLTKERIDDIVLVGGSTRIPKIQEIIKNYFNKEPKKNINADEAVAIGAAIQGAIVNNVDEEGLEKLILLDVTPLSLGLELKRGEMDVLIKRNTTIPCEKEQKYMTVRDNQHKITVKVYQGERILAKENKFLGQCEITNIPPKPKGKVIVNVTFSVDINGSLAVNATETSGGQTSDLIIKMDNALSEKEIEELVQRAKEMEKDDLLVIETTKVKTELLNFCMELKQTGNESQKKKANEIIKWVRKNQEESKETYENKLNEIKNAK